jgi:hypothetical protein
MGGFYVQSHTTKCKDLEKTLDDGLSVDILYSLLVPGVMNNWYQNLVKTHAWELVLEIWISCLQRFPIFWIWTYMMKVIPETPKRTMRQQCLLTKYHQIRKTVAEDGKWSRDLLTHEISIIYIYIVDVVYIYDGIWTHTIDTLQHHSLSFTSSALDHSTISTPYM